MHHLSQGALTCPCSLHGNEETAGACKEQRVLSFLPPSFLLWLPMKLEIQGRRGRLGLGPCAALQWLGAVPGGPPAL